MTVWTLLRYLAGSSDAIVEVASHRSAAGLGLLLVLSAGLAREYDGVDLLHEPWHALLPLLASLVLAFLLYRLLWIVARVREPAEVSFGAGYLSFLGLYWLTAPLAWLYAIPYERFLDPVAAAKANLITLGTVALWRIALMARAVAVLTRCGWVVATFLVLLFADVVSLVLLILDPMPIINAMGGLRFTPAELVVYDVKGTVSGLALLTLPLWLIGTPIACAVSRKARRRPALPRERRPVSAGLRAVAWGSVLVWSAVLPFTQPEQLLRRRVERSFRSGKIEGAFAIMSAHAPKDFPPGWEPPPRSAHWSIDPIVDPLDVLSRTNTAPWVREAYLKKLREWLGIRRHLQSAETSRRLTEILERFPEGPKIRAEFAEDFDRPLKESP